MRAAAGRGLTAGDYSTVLEIGLWSYSGPFGWLVVIQCSVLTQRASTSHMFVRHLLAPWARCARFMHAQCFRVFIYISYVLRAVSLNQAIRYIPSLPLSVTASMSISSKYLCHKVIKYLLHVKVVVFFQLWLLVENDAVLSGSLPQLDFEKSCVICFKIIYCIKGIC